MTAPIFVIVFLGGALRRLHWIDEHFVSTGSKLVFNLALPALIFTKIIQVDLQRIFSLQQVGYALAATLTGFVLVWIHSRRWQHLPAQRGVFVQGAFRGNMGIIGIALCMNMYGDEGLAVGSILLAFLTLMYNVLSVYALSAPFHGGNLQGLARVARDLPRNPLIIAIVLGLLCNQLHWQPGIIIERSAEYLANLTLPLALLCVGATLDLKALRQQSAIAWWACAYKLVLLPVLFILPAMTIGMPKLLLGTLFMMFASPTATASYIMARSMGGDSVLAANIIALSTCLSLFSLSLSLFLFRTLGIL